MQTPDWNKAPKGATHWEKSRSIYFENDWYQKRGPHWFQYREECDEWVPVFNNNSEGLVSRPAPAMMQTAAQIKYTENRQQALLLLADITRHIETNSIAQPNWGPVGDMPRTIASLCDIHEALQIGVE